MRIQSQCEDMYSIDLNDEFLKCYHCMLSKHYSNLSYQNMFAELFNNNR